jgi:DNA-binding SARP family transcriptional activator
MRRTFSGMVALLAIVGFFAGASAGLVVMAGWPLPSGPALRTAVNLHYLSPHLVAQLAACVGWPCLAYLLVTVVHMGADAWHDRSTPARGPAAWLQSMVRRAVAVLVLLSGLLSRTPAWSAPARPAATVALTAAYRLPVRSPSTVALTADNQIGGHPPATAPSVTYRVQPGDELWDIAGTHLHDPLQWRTIWELNQGRPMVDGDGGQRVFEDPRLILPGWDLLMPAGWSPSAPAGSAGTTGSSGTTGPSKATAHPGVSAPVGATAHPGVSTPAEDPQAPTMVALSAADGRARSSRSDVGALVEAGLVGAALLSVIQVLRRRQAQHRPSGRRILLPSRLASETELALSRSETPDRAALVQRGMASLATAMRDLAAPPTILGVLVDRASVEVLLDRPAPAPAPWTETADGFRWRILAEMLPDQLSVDSAPLPALASVGRVAAGAADVLINLEAAGVLGVTGDASRAAGFCYALALQLVGAPWAAAITLNLVAFPPGLAMRDNVREVNTLAEILVDLEMTAGIMDVTAREHGCADLFSGRLRGEAGDGWPPVVVLCAQRPTPKELKMLARIARSGGGVLAVVANAGPLARWEVDVDTSPCPINPLRLAVAPTVVDAETMADIAEILRVADDDGGASLEDPPYDTIELSVDRPLTARVDPAPRSEPGRLVPTIPGPDLPDLGNPPILVRVLGSVEVDGALECKRAKSRELVVYLAMHPNGVGESELDEALWGSNGGRIVLSSTRDSTVSVARTSLGGASRLLPAQGQGREKRYQFGPEVQSDWQQFCTLHRFGREQQSTAALHKALELVRGRPFEAVISGRTYGWIHTEGHGRHIEAEVADAADLAASLYLKAGDPLAARWAARRGLLAEPYTERLWVRLMEAADELGESQEIERIMDEMDIVLELGGDFTSLHPNTLAVYDRLSRRRRFPAET